jgi:chromosome partitioning protein
VKVIAITNQKGGVGKTTTALAMHDSLKERNYKVLLVDTDQQRTSTKQFKAVVDGEYTLYDVLMGECSIDDAIQHLDRGDIVAGDKLLGRMDIALDGMKKYLHMKNALVKMQSAYDYVILDCPPALNTILLNNFTACNEVIIPITAETPSLEGLVELSDTINDVKEMTNPEIIVTGLLLIKYKKNTKHTKAINEQLGSFENLFDTKTFKSRIRESVKQAEAQTERESIFTYAPNSTTAIDYQNFVDEYIKGE